MQNYSHNSKIQQEKHEQNFWDRINEEMQIIDAEKEEFKTQELPLSRIKRLMKLESEILDESAKYMVSSEAPILFAKACEIFILELTLRAWKYADDEKRRTLLSSDITKAVSRSEMYDFLIDIIPREDIQIQEYLQHIKTGSSSTSLPIPLASDPTSQGTSNPQIPLRPLTTSQINPPITYPSQSQQTIAPTPTYVPYTYNSQQTQNQSVYSQLQPQLQPQQQLQLQPQSTTSSIPPIQPYTYPNYPNTSNTTIDHSLHSHNHNNNNNNNKTTTTGNNPTTFYPHNHHISQQQQPQPQHLSHQHHIPDSSTTSTSTPITSTSSISSSLSSYSLQTRPNVYPIYPSQHQTPHG